MEHLNLTEDQWNTVVTALSAARHVYLRDVTRFGAHTPLGKQFTEQANDASQLEDLIREQVGL